MTDCARCAYRISVLDEMESVVKPFFYLAHHQSRSELLQLPDTSVIAETENYVSVWESIQGRKIFDNLELETAGFSPESASASESAGFPLVTSEPDLFPCLLIMSGSTFGAIKVSGLCSV